MRDNSILSLKLHSTHPHSSSRSTSNNTTLTTPNILYVDRLENDVGAHGGYHQEIHYSVVPTREWVCEGEEVKRRYLACYSEEWSESIRRGTHREAIDTAHTAAKEIIEQELEDSFAVEHVDSATLMAIRDIHAAVSANTRKIGCLVFSAEQDFFSYFPWLPGGNKVPEVKGYAIPSDDSAVQSQRKERVADCLRSYFETTTKQGTASADKVLGDYPDIASVTVEPGTTAQLSWLMDVSQGAGTSSANSTPRSSPTKERTEITPARGATELHAPPATEHGGFKTTQNVDEKRSDWEIDW